MWLCMCALKRKKERNCIFFFGSKSRFRATNSYLLYWDSFQLEEEKKKFLQVIANLLKEHKGALWVQKKYTREKRSKKKIKG